MSSYKTTCPSCGGHNLYVTPSNGKRFCFNCAYFSQDGKAEPLKRSERIKEIRELYTELAYYYHSCLEPSHRLYLNKRGITDTTIQTLQLGYVPASSHILYNELGINHAGIARKDGTAFLGDRIVFPYWYKGKVTDIRGRVFSDHPVKYLSPKHSAYFRGADYTFGQDVLSTESEVVITEGEFKAVASNQVGIPAVSIPGILSLRPQLKQKEEQTFVVCFDTQVSNWHDVVRAIHRLAKKFLSVKVATLPLMGREKMDIDTFIVDYGEKAYKEVIRRAIPYSSWLSLVRV